MILFKQDSVVNTQNDSSIFLQGKHLYVTLEKGKSFNEPKKLYDELWFSSFLVPVAVAILTAAMVNWLNRQKDRTELEKVKAETENLKRSFQPVAMSMLQSIQEKTIEYKIDALKRLVAIRSKFEKVDDKADEYGQTYTPQGDERLEKLFIDFQAPISSEFDNLFNEFSYLFPDHILKTLGELNDNLAKLDDYSFKYYEAKEGNDDVTIGRETLDFVRKIIHQFEFATSSIRKDCHLDNTFIRDFIERNK